MCLIGIAEAQKLGLPISGPVNLSFKGVGGRSRFKGASAKVMVSVFDVVHYVTFLVSAEPDAPTLLGRPWARKARLISRNYNNSLSDVD